MTGFSTKDPTMKYKTKKLEAGGEEEDATGDFWLLTDLGYYAYNVTSAGLKVYKK